jgi:sialate O-acetylesterase
MKTILCLIVMVTGLFVSSAWAGEKNELRVNRLFSDHMVLQQQQKVNFWGQCAPGQKLTISASWGAKASTSANNGGHWSVKLSTPKAGGPFVITIGCAGKTIVLHDVLVGEVWLASGQSNMDLPVKGWLPNDTVRNSKQAIAQANYPEIRFLKVPFNTATTPMDSLDGGKWLPASPQTVGDFSATAYFYALKLYQELKVPIGIIQSSIGGTPAEAWTSKESLEKLGDFNSTIDGLVTLQNKINKWFIKWPFQAVPRSDEDWKNLSLADQAAEEPRFDDSKWESIKLPGRFDRLKTGEFDGVLWVRKEFDVQDLSSDYTLKIGSVDDMDESYINGHSVGGIMSSGFATTPRELAVSRNFLVKGKNTIAIRLIDTGGPGSINGFISLSSNKGVVIPLEGEWKSRLVAENLDGKFYNYGLNADISERPNTAQLNSNSPTVLFNAMINPLVPYTIKGVIWYQGESNVGRAEQYKRLFPLMITDWRNKWGYEFPFYYVQIAPNLYNAADQKNQSQKLRDAQRYALKLPKTGMAVTLDIGKMTSAHPAYKQEVGDRLARFAMANEYGQNQVCSGPLYKGDIRSANKLIVEFELASIGSGLVASAAELTGFEVAGADKVFVVAKAKIDGNKVLVDSPSVATPVYVRYAWSDGFAATLFNKEGLPASTFTSEE